ncbi:MAG: hypothetical protein O2923_13445 [Verrucomicrobia bacterium]|nr:hypothetical protein [Verrucomicrobiota bacterium]
MQIRSRRLVVPLVVLLIAMVANSALVIQRGLDKPLESDAFYFLEIAKSLASGHGYTLRSETFWPDQPTMRRLPGWPMTIALFLQLCPAVNADAVARVVCVALNVAAAVLIATLTGGLTRRHLPALLAGALYAVHPVALHFAYLGLSEPLFLFLVLAGLLCFMRGLGCTVAGFAFLGLACLVRANFILWLGLAAAVTVAVLWRDKLKPSRSQLATCLLGVCIFLVPPGVWLQRNHRVSGHFPVLSTLRGQTFYGGNNSVSAYTPEYWGHWVFPNQVPGEIPMAELARTMSEVEVDDYYFRRGLAFIGENAGAMPLLLLGKFVRAYVPIPWKPRIETVVASGFRWLIYVTAALGLWAAWRQTPLFYRICLPSMFLANLAVVLLFYGYVRFAFAFEPFLLPYSGVALAYAWSRLGGTGRSSAGAVV